MAWREIAPDAFSHLVRRHVEINRASEISSRPTAKRMNRTRRKVDLSQDSHTCLNHLKNKIIATKKTKLKTPKATHMTIRKRTPQRRNSNGSATARIPTSTNAWTTTAKGTRIRAIGTSFMELSAITSYEKEISHGRVSWQTP
jgi:hypothetical protein